MSYFDPDGNEIDLDQWNAMFADRSNAIVAATTVHHKWFVSTVWVGINMAPLGPPLIYETVIFEILDKARGRSEEYRRYPNRITARQGHTRLIKQLRKGSYIPFSE